MRAAHMGFMGGREQNVQASMLSIEKHANNPTLGFGTTDELLGPKIDAPQTLFDIDKSEEFENLHTS